MLVWDTERVAKKKGECCGACFCKETNILCCGGLFTSPQQKEYCGMTYSQKQIDDQSAQFDAATPAVRTVLKAGMGERCLGKYFAPIIFSNIGRIVFLIIYVILTAGAVYGATKVEIHFEIDFFISPGTLTYEFRNKQREHLELKGQPLTVFIESPETEWNTEEN